jgi:hypothetical protein
MQELVPGVTWINECYDLGDRHEHVSVYLLTDPDTERSFRLGPGVGVVRVPESGDSGGITDCLRCPTPVSREFFNGVDCCIIR